MKQTTTQLVTELRRIAEVVETGDSFEGSIQYTCMEDGLEKDEWEVTGAYRVGNAEGQGGVRMLAQTTEKGKAP